MPRRYVTSDERRQIAERADKRCEYCKSHMDYSPQSFDIEHVLPVVLGGKTNMDNLALACGGCNSHKYTKVEALDEIEQIMVPLYNPRKDSWYDHFAWSADCLQMIGRTSIGRATVQALNLNRLGLMNIRTLLLMVGLHPPSRK